MVESRSELGVALGQRYAHLLTHSEPAKPLAIANRCWQRARDSSARSLTLKRAGAATVFWSLECTSPMGLNCRSWKRGLLRYRAAVFVRRWPRLDGVLRKSAKRFFSNEANGVLQTLDQLLRTRGEIAAFQWPRREINISNPQHSDYKLQPLSLKLLAFAAMKYEQDAPTIAYLQQCAAWLKSGSKEGLALLDSNGMPVHFCWTTRAVNIPLREIARIKALGSDSTLLSDSWTPNFNRENHLQYLAIVVQQISTGGREPWILAATRDLDFTSGLKRAGFIARFTIPRRSRFSFAHAWRRPAGKPIEPLMDFDTAA